MCKFGETGVRTKNVGNATIARRDSSSMFLSSRLSTSIFGCNPSKAYLDELTKKVLVVYIFLDVDLQRAAKVRVQEELVHSESVIL
jgi:hypothetical protein